MEEILDALLTGDEQEKEAAATELMKAGESALPGLQIALTAGDADARWWATRALAEIPGAEARQRLLAVLADPDEDVRVCAVMALGERRDEMAVQPLLKLMTEGSGYARRQIGDALSKIGEPAVPGLIEALRAPFPGVRADAARALVRIESQQAIPALIKALDDPEPSVEHYAWEALQRMGIGTMFLFKP
jgi:HEAT repeat protein